MNVQGQGEAPLYTYPLVKKQASNKCQMLENGLVEGSIDHHNNFETYLLSCNVDHQNTLKPNNSASKYISKRNLSTYAAKDVCKNIHSYAFYSIAPDQKQPKWSLLGEWIDKLWLIHTAKNSIAMKMKHFFLKFKN